ncbi:alginate lyase family protein [uncultured Williamsia sp.]|uniref:alginate lyase family protein n=1 Tax=uncultured Williamsia sp. TaxID=259311 RepID=UPI002615FB50|nr:alginate lyase family protein [uncultured Williamsia sp.]
MHKVTWYRRRLATMSAAEIGWRVRTLVAGRVRRLSGATPPRDLPSGWTIDTAETALAQLRGPGRRPALLSRERAADIVARHPELVQQIVAAADDAVALRCTFFGYPTVTLTRPVDWSHDPIRDLHWPDLPADRIDHRTIDGDVKWIWELNRLQHLPLLAQAWLVTGDDRYADAALDDLESWTVANPPGHGIAWRGAFEAGIRALSVAVAVAALADAPRMTPRRFGAIAAMLDASARYCVRGRSRYSSANNHLVGELAGLAAVALLMPGLEDAQRWEHIALAGLDAEADRQILPDGVGAEQAVGYQIFTAELLAVVAALVADRDGSAPERLVAAVLRGTDFLGGLGTPTPRIGDDDEGFALRLSDEPVRTVEAHLDLVAGITDGPAPAGTATTPAREWFAAALGGSQRPRTAVTSTIRGAHGSTYHRDGGLVVLRGPGRRVTVDVGPLGYLAIAAHGHADALAVTVADDHGEIVEDPGTGSYYGHPEWRKVLRGTAAHATVGVDGRDQSDMGGPFLWTRHAHTRVRAVDLDAGVVDAEHDGYADGTDGVVHRRWVISPPDLPGVLIVDRLSGSGRHDVTTTFPLAADIEIDTSKSAIVLSREGDHIAEIVTASTSPMSLWSVRGDETTHRGWSSHRLEQRSPAWWVGTQSPGRTTPLVQTSFINVTTKFALGCDLSLSDDGSAIRVRLLCEGVQRECVVDTRGDGQVSLQIETAL